MPLVYRTVMLLVKFNICECVNKDFTNFTCINVHVYMYMYTCIYVCVYVSMHIYIYICIWVY